MTENKRFNIKPSAMVDDVTVIIDDEKKYSFPILDSTLNYMFCKALNELNDKNELFRRNIEDYRKLSLQFERKTNELISDNAFLEKENKELKAKVDDKEVAVEVETCKLMGKIFNLIDKKIDELEGRYKFGQEVYKGCPMHNIRFGINTLKELKKELQE